jgi:hypothetical protein
LARPKRWLPLDLPFLQPGYEYHRDEGYIRHGRGNKLEDYRDKGIPRVTVVAQTGERVDFPSAWLIALAAHGKAMADCLPKPRVDDELCPDVAAKVARYRDCGLPFWQCKRCGEPVPYRVVQWVSGLPAPMYLNWARNTDAELIHEMACLVRLVVERPPRQKALKVSAKTQGPKFDPARRPRTFH